MQAIVAYIRSWFPPVTLTSTSSDRKRRGSDCQAFGRANKHRRILSPISNNMKASDNGFSSPPFSIKSRQPVLGTASRPIIIKDDDDDDNVFESSRFGFKHTSTPSENNSSYLLRNGKLISPNSSRKVDCSFITPFTLSYGLTGNGHNKMDRNESINKQSKCSPAAAAATRHCRGGGGGSANNSKNSSHIRSPSLNYSFRLDDKLRYKELLDKLSPHHHNNINNSGGSFYYTPAGGKSSSYNDVFVFGDRGRNSKMFRSSPHTANDVPCIDLTTTPHQQEQQNDESTKSTKLSTKDTVIKILDDFDNGAVVIDDDSDSDVEILPTPPSPKPDIKVDRVNSLKQVVDTAESTHPEYTKQLYDRYERLNKRREDEIKTIEDHARKLSLINRELQAESLSRKVENCLLIKEAVLPVDELDEEEELPELTEEHLKLIHKGLYGSANEIMIKKFNINITRRDLQTLSGLTWLNDNVINFYMNLIIERGQTDNNKKSLPSCYCMNTFFYQKLLKDGAESLRRWTRRVDIFSNEIICVPIHLGVHWCMAIIYLREPAIRYYDSMGGSNNQCLQALKKYLEYEHFDKKKETLNTNDFVLENVKDIPQQMNGSDCGVFSCTFAEFATRRSKFTFSQKDMPYLRKKMIWEILSGQMMMS